jgi:hypothetical protein
MKLSPEIIDAMQDRLDRITDGLPPDEMGEAIDQLLYAVCDAEADLAEHLFRLDHHQQNSRDIE